MFTPATISDVASKAGVSIKTVSRVINKAPHVHPDTLRKVKAAVEELNYQPNPVAVRLGRMRRRAPIAPISASA